MNVQFPDVRTDREMVFVIFFFLFPYLFYLFFWSCCSHFLHNHYFSRLKCSSSFSSFNKYETDWFFPVIGLDIRSFHFFAFLLCPLHFEHTTVLVTSIARPKWYRSAREFAHPLLLCPCVTLSLCPSCLCQPVDPSVHQSVCRYVLMTVCSSQISPVACLSMYQEDSLCRWSFFPWC